MLKELNGRAATCRRHRKVFASNALASSWDSGKMYQTWDETESMLMQSLETPANIETNEPKTSSPKFIYPVLGSNKDLLIRSSVGNEETHEKNLTTQCRFSLCLENTQKLIL